MSRRGCRGERASFAGCLLGHNVTDVPNIRRLSDFWLIGKRHLNYDFQRILV